MWLVEVDSAKVDLDLVSCTHAFWFSCCIVATIYPSSEAMLIRRKTELLT